MQFSYIHVLIECDAVCSDDNFLSLIKVCEYQLPLSQENFRKKKQFLCLYVLFFIFCLFDLP